MNKSDVIAFVSHCKTAFLGSINEQGQPVIRAMLAPRKIEEDSIYLSTNTSSNKVRQLAANPNASVYFYKRGLFTYRGVCLVGEMQICTDQPTKEAIWRPGDKIFYKQGVTDPDYCVLKLRIRHAECYCDLHTETVDF